MGQKTTTSPAGRGPLSGAPLRMAELVAGLDGPVYVERVALFDAKQRVRAAKAVRKAVELQMKGRGLAFVEVLAECPTHLHLTPQESEAWVREKMLPVFPLGVKKDAAAEPWPAWPRPSFEPESLTRVVGGSAEVVPRYAKGFPATEWGGDIGFKLAGAGGDGAQTAAMLIALAAIDEGFDATHIPSYGPESRGGTSYADVRIAEVEVLSPSAPAPHVLMAFNAPSLARFGPAVKPGGVVIYDSSVIGDPPALDPRLRVLAVPCSRIAVELGRPVVKNIVALGALQGATRLFPDETYLTAIRRALREKCGLIPLNEQAFARGARAVRNELRGGQQWPA
jgi:2-oxoisovalerate ferredoxin oxidoreductase beta subunit